MVPLPCLLTNRGRQLPSRLGLRWVSEQDVPGFRLRPTVLTEIVSALSPPRLVPAVKLGAPCSQLIADDLRPPAASPPLRPGRRVRSHLRRYFEDRGRPPMATGGPVPLLPLSPRLVPRQRYIPRDLLPFRLFPFAQHRKSSTENEFQYRKLNFRFSVCVARIPGPETDTL